MKTFYGYQLTLSFYKNGETVKDYSSASTPVDYAASFSNYSDTNVVYKMEAGANPIEYGMMNLSSLSYQKQLYKPNCIKASIECSTDLRSIMVLLAGFFKEARAKLEVVGYNETEDSSGNKSINVDKGVKAKLIADKYEVYESSPRYDSSQGKMYVDLVMYSPDKVLDTFEYSKAYTNKRLGLDIFKSESSAISSTLETECENMQVLRLSSGDEFLQPYLVQYNETFYSFLARVANRCGEFLYYEDTNHKLNLGTKLAEREEMLLPPPGQQKAIKYNFSELDFDKISFTDFNTSHNREKDSEDFYNNYMVKDSAAPTKSFVRNSELSGNEYFETVEKGKFSSADDERAFVGYSLYESVGKLFTNTMGAGLFLAAVNLVKQNAWDVSKKADAVNEHFDKKFFDGESATKKRLFGSKDSIVIIGDGIVNVNSTFYPLVRNKEVACNRGQVSLQISSDISKNVMLGDRISFSGKEYIVIKVSASFDVVVNSNGSTAIRQPINVVAIPVDGTPMPTNSVEPIRKVGCQKAFVTDVDDPSFLGRVRVRFSWQKDGADSSPWIRVCSQMANSNGGTAFFKAAVGDSVLIDFENGNADMPYVAGFLPTMDQQKNKGQYLSRRNTVVLSSEHGQMMLMSDPDSGNNLLRADALPLMAKLVPGLPSNTSPEERFLGATEFTDYYGTYSVKMSSTDRAITVNSPFGSVSMNAFTGITINAPQGDITIAGKNISLTASNNITIESGLNAKPGSVRYYSDLILGAAADFVVETAAPMVFLDLNYIRNMIEIFIKPCEGTLSLKSGRYLLMQAGGAAAKIPLTGFVIPKGSTANAERDKIAMLHNVLNFIDGAVNTFEYNMKAIDEAFGEAVSTYNDNFTFDSGHGIKYVIDEHAFSFDVLLEKVNTDDNNDLEAFKCDGNFKFTDDYLEYRNTWKRTKCVNKIQWAYNKSLGRIDKLKWNNDVSLGPSTADLAKMANQMVGKLRNVRMSTGFQIGKEHTFFTHVININSDNVDLVADKLLANVDLGNYREAIEAKMKALLKTSYHDSTGRQRKVFKRTLSSVALEYARNSEKIFGMKEPSVGFANDWEFEDDKKWGEYIGSIFSVEKIGFLGQVGASALNACKAVLDKINPFQQLTGKLVQGRRKWSAEGRGQILISDTEGTTMYFNNGTLKSFSNSDLYSIKAFCQKFL